MGSAASSVGETKTHLPSAVWASILMMANSAHAVFPEPDGAQTNTFLSDLNSSWKHCVWMGLNSLYLNSFASAGSPTALGSNGCRSSSSVGGWNLAGRIRWLNEMGSTDMEWSQRSEMTRTKYTGGNGSKMGTLKARACSSSVLLYFNEMTSWCRTFSPLTSSTKTWNSWAYPCTFRSNWNAGVRVRSMRSRDLVIGWICAPDNSKRGN
mmetsp:Transcript_5726/g.16985  ORF Transcript_5726/g.16985 Transcript_5726/m.16985 type:complete len:209 (-) Transcript_5726:3954-4580(-)